MSVTRGARTFWLLAVFAQLSACTEDGGPLVGRGEDLGGVDAGPRDASMDLGEPPRDLGPAPRILVEPRSVDFGEVGADCPAPRDLTVTNLGVDPIEVSLFVGSPVFEALRAYEVLPGGESRAFPVNFRFAAPGAFETSAVVRASWPGARRSEIDVELRAVRTERPTWTDRWTQPEQVPVEFVWIIRPPPPGAARTLRENLQAFSQFVHYQQFGQPSGGMWLDVARRDRAPSPVVLPNEDFADEAMARLEGPPDDGLLDRLVRLVDGDILPRNGDAVLYFILVSHAAEAGQLSVDRVLGALAERRGFRGLDRVRVNTISGGVEGCLDASPAPRLLEIANRTGGVQESVCTLDWSRTLEFPFVGGAIGFQGRFTLTRRPLTESLRVDVDGVRVERTEASGQVNWSYDASAESVYFLPLSIPSPGQNITATYKVADCSRRN